MVYTTNGLYNLFLRAVFQFLVAILLRADAQKPHAMLPGKVKMRLTKKNLAAALAVISAVSYVTFLEVKASQENDDRVTADAVWHPAEGDLAEIKQLCETGQPTDYNGCFIDEMGDYASSQAVAFTQSLAAQKGARLGYLTGLREAGGVDIGYVAYPSSRELSRGWVLVNGTSTIVDADDLTLIPQSEMAKDPQFATLRAKHPQIRLWDDDGDRRPDALPQQQPLPEGGQRFIIDYSLKDLCRTCALLGHASFGFDFDPAGKFLGAKFVKVSATEFLSPQTK